MKLKISREDVDKLLKRANRRKGIATAQGRVAALLRALSAAGVKVDGFAREFPFFGPKDANPWRFDLAHPELRIAIEIDGGNWAGKPCRLCGQRSGGRHSHGAREKERLKLNTATAYGWRVLTFSGESIDRRTEECAALVQRTIAAELTLRSLK
jgi:hypothetical protein